MLSSRDLRVRTSITSPDHPRQIKFLTPREKSRCFDFELGNINLIQSDPFHFLTKGVAGKLKPITLKTNKKCITRNPEATSVSLKMPENSFALNRETKNKSCFPSLYSEKDDRFIDLHIKTCKKREKIEERPRADVIGNRSTKKVTFDDKIVDFSFGDS